MARTPSENVPSTVEKDVVVPEIVDDGQHIKVMSASDYLDMHDKNGTPYGRKQNQKTKLSTEELRILINEKWTPEQVKEKHGIDDEELKQVVWKLSQEERLDKPIKFGKL